MSYQVRLKASADKALDKLPRAIAARVLRKAMALADDPRPPASVKLSGAEPWWRVRIGDYRIVYAIDDQRREVENSHHRPSAGSLSGAVKFPILTDTKRPPGRYNLAQAGLIVRPMIRRRGGVRSPVRHSRRWIELLDR